MTGTEKIVGKKILIVDDEPDVLDALEQLLSMCDVVKASTYQEGKNALETQPFDFAILDIMGVDGYALLELANQKKVIAVMLTAHALNPENIIRSYNEGAASYIPKEKMSEIALFLSDVLEAKEKGRHPWWRWLDRLAESYFERKFGPDWQRRDKKFWEKFKYDLGH